MKKKNITFRRKAGKSQFLKYKGSYIIILYYYRDQYSKISNTQH